MFNNILWVLEGSFIDLSLPEDIALRHTALFFNLHNHSVKDLFFDMIDFSDRQHSVNKMVLNSPFFCYTSQSMLFYYILQNSDALPPVLTFLEDIYLQLITDDALQQLIYNI
jgi:hypothetical protein